MKMLFPLAQSLVLQALVLTLSFSFVGCAEAPTTPVGEWSVRHELLDQNDDVYGFSTSVITVQEDGRFTELLEIDLLEESDPEPTTYTGIWRQDGEIIRFRRDGDVVSHSYEMDKHGLTMRGDIAGYDVVLTRNIE